MLHQQCFSCADTLQMVAKASAKSRTWGDSVPDEEKASLESVEDPPKKCKKPKELDAEY